MKVLIAEAIGYRLNPEGENPVLILGSKIRYV
jgi:hypothetical protein